MYFNIDLIQKNIKKFFKFKAESLNPINYFLTIKNSYG